MIAAQTLRQTISSAKYYLRASIHQGIVLFSLAAMTLTACNSSEKTAQNDKADPDKAQTQQPLSAAEKAYLEKAKKQVVATLNGEEITREHLMYFNQAAKASPLTLRDIAKNSPSELKPLVEEIAVARAASKQLDKLPIAQTEQAKNAMQQTNEQILYQAYLTREVGEKIEEPSEKELKAFYEANSKAFTKPFHFSMRQIFIPNYAPVETKEGDTLENLAARISGDTNLTSMILVDNALKSPRAPNYGSNKAIAPLQPGENLLVPLGAEGKKANLEKIRQAEQKLKAGEDFIKVGMEFGGDNFSSTVATNLGLSGRPLLPQIVQAARETPVNSFSKIFETKHGFNILQIVEKKEEAPAPLSEVRGEIRSKLMKQRQDDLIQTATNNLLQSSIAKIEYEKIKDPSTSPTTPVLTIGSKTYTNKDVQIEQVSSPSKTMTDEAVRTMLRSNINIRKDLMLQKARAEKLEQTSTYKGLQDGYINFRKMGLFLQYQTQQMEQMTVSVADARKYFEANKSRFMTPPAHTYYQLVLNTPDMKSIAPEKRDETVNEYKMKASELVKNVASLEDFKQVVLQHSDDPEAKQTSGLVQDMYETRIDAPILKDMQSLAENQQRKFTNPQFRGNQVFVVWPISVKEPRPAKLEDFQDVELQSIVKKDKISNLDKEMRAQWLKEANIAMR